MAAALSKLIVRSTTTLAQKERDGPKAVPLWFRTITESVIAVAVVIAVMAVASEIKEIEKIANCRAVEGHVGIIIVDPGIRKIIAAAMC